MSISLLTLKTQTIYSGSASPWTLRGSFNYNYIFQKLYHVTQSKEHICASTNCLVELHREYLIGKTSWYSSENLKLLIWEITACFSPGTDWQEMENCLDSISLLQDRLNRTSSIAAPLSFVYLTNGHSHFSKLYFKIAKS